MSGRKKAGLQSLADYIEEKYGGNQNAFSIANGCPRQQVTRWLKAEKPIFVVDGKMVALLRELELAP